MQDIREQKRQLRRELKTLKSRLSPAQMRGEALGVLSQLEGDADFQRATTILAYWSMPDELPTPFIVGRALELGKRVALPVVRGEELLLLQYTGRDCLAVTPPFGILEPQNTPVVQPSEIDYALIPGVAFDAKGNRMGRGKGFYDRLLGSLTRATLVGICLRLQLIDSVPVEPHDRAMDRVITAPERVNG